MNPCLLLRARRTCSPGDDERLLVARRAPVVAAEGATATRMRCPAARG